MMRSSEEKSEELLDAMKKFKSLDKELEEVLSILRKYMKVERTWVFMMKEKEEWED